MLFRKLISSREFEIKRMIIRVRNSHIKTTFNQSKQWLSQFSARSELAETFCPKGTYWPYFDYKGGKIQKIDVPKDHEKVDEETLVSALPPAIQLIIFLTSHLGSGKELTLEEYLFFFPYAPMNTEFHNKALKKALCLINEYPHLVSVLECFPSITLNDEEIDIGSLYDNFLLYEKNRGDILTDVAKDPSKAGNVDLNALYKLIKVANPLCKSEAEFFGSLKNKDIFCNEVNKAALENKMNEIDERIREGEPTVSAVASKKVAEQEKRRLFDKEKRAQKKADDRLRKNAEDIARAREWQEEYRKMQENARKEAYEEERFLSTAEEEWVKEYEEAISLQQGNGKPKSAAEIKLQKENFNRELQKFLENTKLEYREKRRQEKIADSYYQEIKKDNEKDREQAEARYKVEIEDKNESNGKENEQMSKTIVQESLEKDIKNTADKIQPELETKSEQDYLSKAQEEIFSEIQQKEQETYRPKKIEKSVERETLEEVREESTKQIPQIVEQNENDKEIKSADYARLAAQEALDEASQKAEEKAELVSKEQNQQEKEVEDELTTEKVLEKGVENEVREVVRNADEIEIAQDKEVDNRKEYHEENKKGTERKSLEKPETKTEQQPFEERRKEDLEKNRKETKKKIETENEETSREKTKETSKENGEKIARETGNDHEDIEEKVEYAETREITGRIALKGNEQKEKDVRKAEQTKLISDKQEIEYLAKKITDNIMQNDLDKVDQETTATYEHKAKLGEKTEETDLQKSRKEQYSEKKTLARSLGGAEGIQKQIDKDKDTESKRIKIAEQFKSLVDDSKKAAIAGKNKLNEEKLAFNNEMERINEKTDEVIENQTRQHEEKINQAASISFVEGHKEETSNKIEQSVQEDEVQEKLGAEENVGQNAEETDKQEAIKEQKEGAAQKAKKLRQEERRTRQEAEEKAKQEEIRMTVEKGTEEKDKLEAKKKTLKEEDVRVATEEEAERHRQEIKSLSERIATNAVQSALNEVSKKAEERMRKETEEKDEQSVEKNGDGVNEQISTPSEKSLSLVDSVRGRTQWRRNETLEPLEQQNIEKYIEISKRFGLENEEWIVDLYVWQAQRYPEYNFDGCFEALLSLAKMRKDKGDLDAFIRNFENILPLFLVKNGGLLQEQDVEEIKKMSGKDYNSNVSDHGKFLESFNERIKYEEALDSFGRSVYSFYGRRGIFVSFKKRIIETLFDISRRCTNFELTDAIKLFEYFSSGKCKHTLFYPILALTTKMSDEHKLDVLIEFVSKHPNYFRGMPSSRINGCTLNETLLKQLEQLEDKSPEDIFAENDQLLTALENELEKDSKKSQLDVIYELCTSEEKIPQQYIEVAKRFGLENEPFVINLLDEVVYPNQKYFYEGVIEALLILGKESKDCGKIKDFILDFTNYGLSSSLRNPGWISQEDAEKIKSLSGKTLVDIETNYRENLNLVNKLISDEKRFNDFVVEHSLKYGDCAKALFYIYEECGDFGIERIKKLYKYLSENEYLLRCGTDKFILSMALVGYENGNIDCLFEIIESYPFFFDTFNIYKNFDENKLNIISHMDKKSFKNIISESREFLDSSLHALSDSIKFLKIAEKYSLKYGSEDEKAFRELIVFFESYNIGYESFQMSHLKKLQAFVIKYNSRRDGYISLVPGAKELILSLATMMNDEGKIDDLLNFLKKHPDYFNDRFIRVEFSNVLPMDRVSAVKALENQSLGEILSDHNDILTLFKNDIEKVKTKKDLGKKLPEIQTLKESMQAAENIQKQIDEDKAIEEKNKKITEQFKSFVDNDKEATIVKENELNEEEIVFNDEMEQINEKTDEMIKDQTRQHEEKINQVESIGLVERSREKALDGINQNVQEEGMQKKLEDEEDVRQNAEEKAKRADIKKQQEEQTRKDAEERARREAEEKAKLEEEVKRIAEEAEKLKREEERVKQETEEKARREKELQNESEALEAEERAREIARVAAEKEAEETERNRQEEVNRIVIEEQIRKDAEERAKLETEKQAQKDAEEKAQYEKELQREMQEKLEAEEKAKQKSKEEIREEEETHQLAEDETQKNKGFVEKNKERSGFEEKLNFFKSREGALITEFKNTSFNKVPKTASSDSENSLEDLTLVQNQINEEAGPRSSTSAKASKNNLDITNKRGAVENSASDKNDNKSLVVQTAIGKSRNKIEEKMEKAKKIIDDDERKKYLEMIKEERRIEHDVSNAANAIKDAVDNEENVENLKAQISELKAHINKLKKVGKEQEKLVNEKGDGNEAQGDIEAKNKTEAVSCNATGNALLQTLPQQETRSDILGMKIAENDLQNMNEYRDIMNVTKLSVNEKTRLYALDLLIKNNCTEKDIKIVKHLDEKQMTELSIDIMVGKIKPLIIHTYGSCRGEMVMRDIREGLSKNSQAISSFSSVVNGVIDLVNENGSDHDNNQIERQITSMRAEIEVLRNTNRELGEHIARLFDMILIFLKSFITQDRQPAFVAETEADLFGKKFGIHVQADKPLNDSFGHNNEKGRRPMDINASL